MRFARYPVEVHVKKVLEDVLRKIRDRVKKHGPNPFEFRYQAYGVLAEEVAELLEAIRSNKLEEYVSEFEDVAVTAIWALASVCAHFDVDAEFISPESFIEKKDGKGKA